jgi:ribosomal protein S14
MNRKFTSRQVLDEKKNIKTKSFFTEEKENKLSARFKKSGYSKTKNFCLFLGKGRTYNRKIFISRQIFRKLLRLNNLIGFQK